MKELPKGSADFQALNPHVFQLNHTNEPEIGYHKFTPNQPVERLQPKLSALSITIVGQVRGGKNNMAVTRKGLHFPKKEWARWRDQAVAQVKSQVPKNFKVIDYPVNVRLIYVAGDKRRRDFPAICDALWHVLEKAGVVTDDTFLWPSESTRDYDKANPMAVIEILER